VSCVALLLAVGLLGAPGVLGAGSRAKWSPPVDFAAVSVSTDASAIALDDAGDAALAWLEPNGRAAARLRPSGHGFGPTAILSAENAPVYGAPLAAVDPHGNATVLWISEIAGHSTYATEVQAADSPAGKSFGRPATVFGQPSAATRCG